MSSNTRFAELMSRMLDDAISDEEITELHGLVEADPSLRSQLVDHLLLDTLLEENLGQEPLTALIDTLGDTTSPGNASTSLPAKQQTPVVLPKRLGQRRILSAEVSYGQKYVRAKRFRPLGQKNANQQTGTKNESNVVNHLYLFAHPSFCPISRRLCECR